MFPYVRLPAYLSFCPSVFLSFYISVLLSYVPPSVCLCVLLSVRPSNEFKYFLYLRDHATDSFVSQSFGRTNIDFL
jgi:hypothetical protein